MFHSKKQIILSSLLSVFLVGTLVITSTLMSNPNFSLDIRNYAAKLEPEEEAFLKKFTKDNTKTANIADPPANNSNSEPKERKERIQRDDEIKDDPSTSTVVAPPVVTPPPTTTKTDEQIEEDFLRKNLQNKQTTSAPTTVSPTSAPPVVTPPPATVKTDEQIEEDFLRSNLQNKQTTSASTTISPTSAPLPSTTTQTTSTTKTDEQIEQEYMEKRQKTVAQSPVKTPAPTPNIAMEQFRCGERGGDWIKGQCQSPGSTPTPKPTAATPKPTSTPERLTRLYSDDRCGGLKSGESCVLVQGTGQYGIVQNSSATVISYNSTSPAGTPTPKVDGSKCESSSECESGSCYATSTSYSGGAFSSLSSMNVERRCHAASPAEMQQFQKTESYAGPTLLVIAATVLAPEITLRALDAGDTLIAMRQCAASPDQNSPACLAAIASLMAPPGAGFADDMVDLVDSLAKPLNNLLDNTVFTGLTNDEYWGGGFSNSGGQTLLSRSNMPASLTPQEQSLWLAKADIVENWNYYQTYGGPSKWTNVGYQPNAAAELYQPSNINEALDNVPDPLEIINNLEQQSSLGATPAEILANSRSYIESNGIIILETPPPTEQWWVSTPDGQGLSWSDGLSQPLSNSPTFGIYSGKDDAIALSVEGTKFAFPSDYSSFPLPYKPYDGDAILLNRQALDELGPSKELQTVIHEAGHAVESSYTPQVTSNFWYKNQETEKWMVSQETGAAATEYISTLYGIKAAQALAPTNINMAIDNMINQLLLNTNIINPNPSYLLNN